jgi:carboxyl-terminal processing protease
MPLLPIISLSLCVLLAAGCSKINTQTPPTSAPPVPSTPTPSMTAEVTGYLAEVFGVLQTHSFKRHQVDWDALETEVYARESRSQSTFETYDSIEYLLTRLEDHHSFFMPPQAAGEFNAIALEDIPAPESMLVEDKYAYLKVPGFASGGRQANQDYATALQALVMDLDAHSPCGYVIDLRENNGGNLLPMVAGVGVLIGEGAVGSFADADGNYTDIVYQDGQAWIEGESDLPITVSDVHLQVDRPPIAILIGRDTLSSGEMLALAFKGVPNTILFGHATQGLTTGNDMFELSDGALIFLTTDVFMDRTGKVYGAAVEPDQPIIAGFSKAIPDEVIEWLQELPACKD